MKGWWWQGDDDDVCFICLLDHRKEYLRDTFHSFLETFLQPSVLCLLQQQPNSSLAFGSREWKFPKYNISHHLKSFCKWVMISSFATSLLSLTTSVMNANMNIPFLSNFSDRQLFFIHRRMIGSSVYCDRPNLSLPLEKVHALKISFTGFIVALFFLLSFNSWIGRSSFQGISHCRHRSPNQWTNRFLGEGHRYVLFFLQLPLQQQDYRTRVWPFKFFKERNCVEKAGIERML